MRKFSIQVKNGWTEFSYYVEEEPTKPGFEKFRVSRNDQVIVLESNRPLIRKLGLKTKRPHWDVLEGRLDYSSDRKKIVDALMEYLDRK